MTRKAEIDPVIAEYEKLCAYNPEQGEGFLKGVLAVAEGRVAFDAHRGRWITAYPNGKDHEGRPLFIGPDDRVLAGLGKANGQRLDELGKSKAPEPLAWRGSSQRRNTKEDYEEREYWINEKRQSSKKELKREQKKAQKLERQSEQAAQKLQEHPLSPEQKRAEATRQRFLNTPLPDHFESSGQAVDYLNKVAPNVDATDLKYMPAQRAHDVAFAVSKLGTNFPHAFDKGFTFRLPIAETQRIREMEAQLEEKIKSGQIRAEMAAELERSLKEPMFLERSLSQAVRLGELNLTKRGCYKVISQLKAMTEKYGFDPNTVTISELAHSPAVDEFKQIWVANATGAQIEARKAEISSRRIALDEILQARSADTAAQYNCDTRHLWLVAPIFEQALSVENLDKFERRYRGEVEHDGLHKLYKPFHPPLKESVSAVSAITVHELVHCLDFSVKGRPISSDIRIKRQLDQGREAYLELMPSKDRDKTRAAFATYDKTRNDKDEPPAPYALYSCQEFVAECITECLTATEPSKTAQDTLKLFIQVYNMRVDNNGV